MRAIRVIICGNNLRPLSQINVDKNGEAVLKFFVKVAAPRLHRA
jgi:hypothetical protein